MWRIVDETTGDVIGRFRYRWWSLRLAVHFANRIHRGGTGTHTYRWRKT